MPPKTLLSPLLAALLLTASCGDGDAIESTVSSLFNLGSGQDKGYFALPYPNELRRTAQGTIDMGNLADDRAALLKIYFTELAKNSSGGFPLNGAVHFRFDGTLAKQCLPSGPSATIKPGSPVILVDIDKTSNGYGKAVPVETKFSDKAGEFIGKNSLAVLPVPGFPLAPGTLYAALLTDGLCDELGAAIMAAPDLSKLLAAAAPADAALAKAHTTYAPLRAYLKEKGLTGVISATIFRTGKPTELAGKAREVVYGLTAPVAEKVEVAIDGVNYLEIRGSYKAPNFQSGKQPFFNLADGGAIKVDSGGKPVVAFSESMRFALTIPKGAAMPTAGWPVVLYAHGTGGSYRSFISNYTAEKLAEVKDKAGAVLANIAVVGIDQNLHGPRGGGLSAEVTFFNFLNPAASVHNVVQAGVDNYSLLRMIKGFTASSLPWRAKSGKTGSVTFTPPLKFDPLKIYFMGHSQGGLTGPVALAYEPEIKAAVMSGAGGGAINSLLEKTAPTPIRTILEIALDEPADRFHPFLSMLQGLLEPAEPLNYAKLMISSPPAGRSPLHLLLTEGLVDHYTPNVTTESLAVATGVPLVGTVLKEVAALDLAGLKPMAGPVSGNITVGTKAVTGGLVQFNARVSSPAKSCSTNTDCSSGDYCSAGKCHDDGHFVVFQVGAARDLVSRYFGTMVKNGTPSIQP